MGGFLGVTIDEVTDGIKVTEVDSGSAAEASNLKINDTITSSGCANTGAARISARSDPWRRRFEFRIEQALPNGTSPALYGRSTRQSLHSAAEYPIVERWWRPSPLP